MRRDSLAYALAGAMSGLLMGWIIGSQHAAPAAVAAVAPAAQAPADTASSAPPPFDPARATTLENEAKSDPRNAAVREQLGNLYFDAERYDQAMTWYEASLAIDPKNVNASTDLAVTYFYTNQADRALAQLDRSLALDPGHLKSLLNLGIIRARGKNDLTGAAEAWERVVRLAPTSEEGRLAQQGLEGIKSAHANAQSGNGPGAGSARP